MNLPVLYLEGTAGISGDMILAAFLDLGFPLAKLRQTLKKLPIPLGVQEKKVKQGSLKARFVEPILLKKENPGMNTSDFLNLVKTSTLSSSLKEKTTCLFLALAKAEATVHEMATNSLHFHELGGWDTLLDFVGTAAALEHFNLSEILAGPLNVGGGSVKSVHGTLPVPAPAVLELLKGFNLYSTGVNAELVTPTGAAILYVFGKPASHLPPMIFHQVGRGAGKQKLDFPNVLRLFLGETSTSSGFMTESVLKLETNIDDMNPQFWDHIFEILYEAGTLEVWITPVFMKKNRPGYVLNILASPEKENDLVRILFEETTSLGTRKQLLERTVLKRKFIEIPTPYGKIPCKVGYENGKILNIAPEYEAAKKISKEKKIPLKYLYHLVMKAAPSYTEVWGHILNKRESCGIS